MAIEPFFTNLSNDFLTSADFRVHFGFGPFRMKSSDQLADEQQLFSEQGRSGRQAFVKRHLSRPLNLAAMNVFRECVDFHELQYRSLPTGRQRQQI